VGSRTVGTHRPTLGLRRHGELARLAGGRRVDAARRAARAVGAGDLRPRIPAVASPGVGERRTRSRRSARLDVVVRGVGRSAALARRRRHAARTLGNAHRVVGDAPRTRRPERRRSRCGRRPLGLAGVHDRATRAAAGRIRATRLPRGAGLRHDRVGHARAQRPLLARRAGGAARRDRVVEQLDARSRARRGARAARGVCVADGADDGGHRIRDHWPAQHSSSPRPTSRCGDDVRRPEGRRLRRARGARHRRVRRHGSPQTRRRRARLFAVALRGRQLVPAERPDRLRAPVRGRRRSPAQQDGWRRLRPREAAST